MKDKLISLLENCMNDETDNITVDDPYCGYGVEYENIANYLIENGVVVKSMAKKEFAEYRQYLRDRDSGRILTPDGLRLICEAYEYDPEKIGRHFLEVLGNYNKE